jgi:hypothetical protein
MLVGASVPFGWARTKLSDFDAIAAAIARGPVVIGLALDIDAWAQAKKDGMLRPATKSRVASGHAVLGVAFDESRDAITFRNSWGSAWGDKGYGYATRLFVSQHLRAAYAIG